MAWPERHPGRLEFELEALERDGLEFALDEEERARGRLVLRGALAVDDEEIPLNVVFPDNYPFFRPEVFAPSLSLGRHQNPHDKNLCLLPTNTAEWRTTDTVAWLLSTQVPYLIRLVREGGAKLEAAEVPQGEPASAYVPRLEGSSVLVPQAALELPAEARAGVAYFSYGAGEPSRVALRVLLRQLNVVRRAGGSRPAADADPPLQRRFTGPTIEGRWMRLEEPPGRDPEEYFKEAEAVQAGYGSPPVQEVSDGRVSVLGLVFREEVRQGVFEDAWVFGVRFQTDDGKAGAYLTKGDRYAPEDLTARIPMLAPLAQRRVALLGLGALGAPIALELARCQVGSLNVLDDDLVEAGTTVRWPLGLPAVGHDKTEILTSTIRSHYPRVEVEPFRLRLGRTSAEADPGTPDEHETLNRFLDGADLVIDATAELGVQQLVGHYARERGLTQVYVWATEGAWGGCVARCTPGSSGCWHCLQLRLDDRSLAIPPFEPNGSIQPRGCGSLTFTGASFDLLPVIAQTLRVAVATATGEGTTEDVSILRLRDDDGSPLQAPRWETFPLAVHPLCPLCHEENAATPSGSPGASST